MKKIFIPLGVVIIFLSMYLTLFLTDSLPDSQVIAVLFGLLAYSISLANIYMASRPRYLEKIIGFHSIYTIHAQMIITSSL